VNKVREETEKVPAPSSGPVAGPSSVPCSDLFCFEQETAGLTESAGSIEQQFKQQQEAAIAEKQALSDAKAGKNKQEEPARATGLDVQQLQALQAQQAAGR